MINRDSEGNPVRMSEVNFDITEQEHAEAALLENVASRHALMEAIPNPIFYKDRLGKYTDCNAAFEAFIDMDKGSLVGKTVFDISSQELAAKYHEMDMQLMREGGTQVYDLFVRRSDGAMRNVIFSKATVADTKGSVVGLVGVIFDVTDRNKIEDDRYKRLVDESTHYVFSVLLKDESFPVNTTHNKTCTGVTGYSADDFNGNPHLWANMIEPEDRTKVLYTIKLLLADRETKECEYRIRRKDGEIIYVLQTLVPNVDPFGKLIGYEGVVRDITLKKVAEKQLYSTQQLLIETQQIGLIGGWRANPFTDYIDWTDGISLIRELPMDYKPNLTEALKGYLPEYVPVIREALRACMVTGKTFKIQCELITAGGKQIWVELRGLPEMREGVVTCVKGTMQNITTLVNAKMAIERQRIHLEHYLNMAGVIIIAISADRKINMVNRRGSEIFGYAEGELVGKDFFDCLAAESSRSDEEAKFLEILRGNLSGSKYFESLIAVKSGAELLIAWNSVFLLDSGGNVSEVLLSGNDITDKINDEKRALRSAELASLGELAAGVAHEINNPINGIINYGQMLLNQSEPDCEARKLASLIVKEGDRIAAIVTSLLSYARIGKTDNKPISVSACIDEALMLTKAHLHKDGITLIRKDDDGLPLIFGESQHISQVLLNLISNARYALNLKHPVGHRDKILDMRTECVEKAGLASVRLTMTDHGCGISAEVMPYLFKPFYSTKVDGDGTGLGLSISRGIIERLGGSITIDSKKGEYSAVTVELPAVQQGEGRG